MAVKKTTHLKAAAHRGGKSLPEYVHLTQVELDVGVVLGVEADTLAADLVAETGRPVSIRRVDTDKVLRTVLPARQPRKLAA